MPEEKSVTESEAYTMAVGLLARREHSVRELVTKLGARGVIQELASLVVARLAEERLQSDERYTENYLRQRCQKGYGPLRISAELRERGVAEELISKKLRQAEQEGEVDWYEGAAAVYLKKYGSRLIEDMKERARRMRFLQYRGFSREQIAAAMHDK